MPPHISLSFLMLTLAGSLLAQTGTPPGSARTLHYELRFEDLKFVYGPLPPVMRLRPGDTLETTTVDAEGKDLEAHGMKDKGPNPLKGPF